MNGLGESTEFKIKLCIICQSKIKDEKEVSSTVGRNRIREAAELHRDVVYHRLNALSVKGEY